MPRNYRRRRSTKTVGTKRRGPTSSGTSTRRTWSKRIKDTGISVLDLLALAHAVHQHAGWLSAKRAAAGDRASWETIYEIHQDLDSFKNYQAAHPGFRVDADDETAAAAILAWCQDQSVDDLPIADYRQALKFATGADEVTGQTFRLVCSAVDAYLRDVAPARPSLHHVGVVGERSTFTLTLQSVSSRQARVKRGRSRRARSVVMHRLAFVDSSDNAVIWFSSNSPEALGLSLGGCYEIKATVREHEDFRGSLQTKITRGTIVGSALAARGYSSTAAGQPEAAA